MNDREYATALYRYVDARDCAMLGTLLDDSVHFRFANHPSVNGKPAVLEANQAFFSTIKQMNHELHGVWSQNNHLICNGLVHYLRLDGSEFSATFATILELKDEKIVDYLIYADVADL